MRIVPSPLKLQLSHRLLAVKLPCGSCFGYILLYNNYLKIQKLITAHVYYLTVSVGQEFGLSWVLLARGLSWDYNQDEGQDCSHPSLDFQGGSLTWLLAGGFGFSVPGPFHRKLECPFPVAVSFSQSRWSEREQARSHKSLSELVFEVAQCHGHLLKGGLWKSYWTSKNHRSSQGPAACLALQVIQGMQATEHCPPCRSLHLLGEARHALISVIRTKVAHRKLSHNGAQRGAFRAVVGRHYWRRPYKDRES